MPRLRTTIALNSCLLTLAVQTSASAALAARQLTPRSPGTVEAVMEQAQNGVIAVNRQRSPHFLSPDASSAVAPHVMTPHDREVLRQQIQGSVQGVQAGSQSAPAKSHR